MFTTFSGASYDGTNGNIPSSAAHTIPAVRANTAIIVTFIFPPRITKSFAQDIAG